MNDIDAVLARATLVWVIPRLDAATVVGVTADVPAGRTLWTYPSGARRHPRVPTDTVARRVLSVMLACGHHDLRPIAVIDPPAGSRRAPAAIYTARVSWPGAPPVHACCGRHRIGTFRINPPPHLRPAYLTALLTDLDRTAPARLHPDTEPSAAFDAAPITGETTRSHHDR
jgi:hypothetical protein